MIVLNYFDVFLKKTGQLINVFFIYTKHTGLKCMLKLWPISLKSRRTTSTIGKRDGRSVVYEIVVFFHSCDRV